MTRPSETYNDLGQETVISTMSNNIVIDDILIQFMALLAMRRSGLETLITAKSLLLLYPLSSMILSKSLQGISSRYNLV